MSKITKLEVPNDGQQNTINKFGSDRYSNKVGEFGLHYFNNSLDNKEHIAFVKGNQVIS